MKKIYLIALFAIFFVIFTSSCSIGGDKPEDKPVEALLPQNPLMVMAVDFSDDQQRSKFKDLINTFPQTNFKQFINEQLLAQSEVLNYENIIAPYVSDNWKILLATDLPEDAKDVNKDMIIYLAGKFEKADSFENALKQILQEEFGEDVKYSEDGPFAHWVIEDEDLFISRYGDIFWLTNNRSNRDKAAKRLVEGTGFEIPSDLPTNIAYMYSDYTGFKDLFSVMNENNDNPAFSDMGVINSYLNAFGELYLYVRAEKKGFRVISDFDMQDDSFFKDLYADKKLSLINKVPADGIIMYFEDVSFRQTLSVFAMSMQSAFMNAQAKSESSLNLSRVAEAFNSEYYHKMLDIMAENSSLSADQLDEKFDNSFAFAIYDTGYLIPGFVFYLNSSDSMGLTEIVDSFVDGVIEGIDANFKGSMFSSDILQRDVAVIDGSPLKKVYFDYSNLPEGALVNFSDILRTDLSEQKIEIYYGPTNDDVFVIDFYAEFNDFYGEEVLAENENYKIAVESLNSLGANLIYFDTASLLSYADSLFELIEKMNPATEEQRSIYEEFKLWLDNIDYVVSSNSFTDGELKADTFVRIGK